MNKPKLEFLPGPCSCELRHPSQAQTYQIWLRAVIWGGLPGLESWFYCFLATHWRRGKWGKTGSGERGERFPGGEKDSLPKTVRGQQGPLVENKGLGIIHLHSLSLLLKLDAYDGVKSTHPTGWWLWAANQDKGFVWCSAHGHTYGTSSPVTNGLRLEKLTCAFEAVGGWGLGVSQGQLLGRDDEIQWAYRSCRWAAPLPGWNCWAWAPRPEGSPWPRLRSWKPWSHHSCRPFPCYSFSTGISWALFTHGRMDYVICGAQCKQKQEVPLFQS